MDNNLLDGLIAMTKQSSAPLILLDDSLSVAAFSTSFAQCLVHFDGNIHTLFDSNALQRIKRSRKTLSSLHMKTKTLPFVMHLSFNWISLDENTACLLGIVEKNQLSKANHSLAVAYSCVERSQESISTLNRLMTMVRSGQCTEEELDKMTKQIHTISRNYDNLLKCVTLLTDSLILNTRDHDIVRIIRRIIEEAQKKILSRGIRIQSKLPHLSCNVNCDFKNMIAAISSCLYTLLYFTQDNHHITIDLVDHTDYYEIILTDPLYKIPDEYAERLFVDDVIIPGSNDHAGLYFTNAVIRKHKGTLELDQSPPLGYQLKIALPSAPKNHLIFEDADDSAMQAMIDYYVQFALFDL